MHTRRIDRMAKIDSDATIARLRKAHAIATRNDKALRKIVAARNATIAELQTTGRDLAAAHATATRDLAKRDAAIATLQRHCDDQDAAWRVSHEREIEIGASIIAKRDATIEQLKADVAARDKRITELAADHDNDIHILSRSIAASDATIAQLRADA